MHIENRNPIFIIVGALALLFLGSCISTKPYTHASYTKEKQLKIKRISIKIKETDEIPYEHLSLFGEMAFHFIDKHKKLIVYKHQTIIQDPLLDQMCIENETSLDAFLLIIPRKLKKDHTGVQIAATASLIDCKEKRIIWSRRGGTTYQQHKPKTDDFEEKIRRQTNPANHIYIYPIKKLIWNLLSPLGQSTLSATEEKERQKIHLENKTF